MRYWYVQEGGRREEEGEAGRERRGGEGEKRRRGGEGEKRRRGGEGEGGEGGEGGKGVGGREKREKHTTCYKNELEGEEKMIGRRGAGGGSEQSGKWLTKGFWCLASFHTLLSPSNGSQVSLLSWRYSGDSCCRERWRLYTAISSALS